VSKRTCKIHGDPLLHDRVEIRSGMPPGPPPDGDSEARRDLFPNSKVFVFGGCFVPEEPSARVYFCQACRTAEKDWQSQRDVSEFWQV